LSTVRAVDRRRRARVLAIILVVCLLLSLVGGLLSATAR
jgi:predicted PurR-regulated permease PerM